MPILGSLSNLPAPGDWNEADSSFALECRNEARTIFAEVPSSENQQHLNEAADASIAAYNGEEVWIAKSPNSQRMRFAVGKRYVEEGEHVILDELIDEGSYIVDGPNVDIDLKSGAPFDAVIKELRNSSLIVVDGNRILFDSFVSEDDFQSAVTCALEQWDMSTTDFRDNLER